MSGFHFYLISFVFLIQSKSHGGIGFVTRFLDSVSLAQSNSPVRMSGQGRLRLSTPGNDTDTAAIYHKQWLQLITQLLQIDSKTTLASPVVLDIYGMHAMPLMDNYVRSQCGDSCSKDVMRGVMSRLVECIVFQYSCMSWRECLCDN